ncbi:MAG: hypothetical protein JRI64_09270 [Deltaproteobacteria bacterium]|nr:hypothetical protein [Deltaproteobacteria bacterium]
MKQSICRLLITGAVILFFTTMAHAETRYVTDKMQITFRTGPGNDRKILSLLNSGQPRRGGFSSDTFQRKFPVG